MRTKAQKTLFRVPAKEKEVIGRKQRRLIMTSTTYVKEQRHKFIICLIRNNYIIYSHNT